MRQSSGSGTSRTKGWTRALDVLVLSSRPRYIFYLLHCTNVYSFASYVYGTSTNTDAHHVNEQQEVERVEGKVQDTDASQTPLICFSQINLNL